MAASRDDGWGSVFSDLDPEATRAPAPDASRRPEPEAEEATDPALAAPAWSGPAYPADEAPTETSAPAPPAAFREADLLSTLEGPPPIGGSPASREPPGGWREYRELISTAVIGVAALAAAIAWGRWRPEPSEPPAPRPTPQADPPRPQVERARPVPRRAAPEPTRPRPAESRRTEAAAPKAAALPMLSVVTRPPGAMVRIDGVVYGRTPLIMQAPTDRERFEVELRLDDHRPWTGTVAKDDAGHFSINTELEPRAP